MSSEDPEPPRAGKQLPYADATPAELREAILPEEQAEFDAHLQRTKDAVVETFSFEPLWEFLEHWRIHARLANHRGHDHWRGVLDRARRIEAGERFPTISGEEMKQRITQRLAAGR